MMHRFSPLLTSDDNDMESEDEALQTPPSLDRRCKLRKQMRSSPDHDDGEEPTEKHNDRPLWTHSYISPIDSDIDDGTVKHCRRGRPKSAIRPTKRVYGVHQDFVKVEEMLKRGSKPKQIKSACINPVERDSESESGVSKGTQKKRGRPQKVNQALDVSENPVQESKTGASTKEKTQKLQNNKRANRQITRDITSDHENEVPSKRAKQQKAPTSKKLKGWRTTTQECAASPNHSFSDLDDTAGRQKSKTQKTSVQNFERSSDVEDDRLSNSSPGNSDKHTDDSDSEVESASFIRSGRKIRKKNNLRRSLKERSSSYKSEDDEKKRRRKTTTKRKKLDFLEWPRGSSSARSSTQKITTKRKQEGPFECNICGRSIRCQAIMQRHMLTHTGEKPFECDECGRRYTSMSNLRIHQQSHTGKMDYSCEECGQKFTHLSYLKRHLLRHSGKKLHMCDQCGKGFIQKYHLNRHLLVHSGKMPYACDKCNASFNRTDYLSLHMRNVHLIEGSGSESMAKPKKPHKCDLCEKEFMTRTTLEAHGRVHTGVTPYSCSICQRRFKQSSQMHAHMRTHSGDKPHSCDLCGMKFARRYYVKIHKERRHATKSSLPQSS